MLKALRSDAPGVWHEVSIGLWPHEKYDGTVFRETHDENRMEEVGSRVWHFDGNTIPDFKGIYEENTATPA